LVDRLDKAAGGPDLALLKISEPQALANVASIGVSFWLPRLSTDLIAVGYPNKQGDPVWRIDRAKLSGRTGDSLVVTQPVGLGNSGSPLFDAYGCVRGICVQDQGPGLMTAIYIWIDRARPLLDKLPLSADMASLDAKVRRRAISPAALDSILVGEPPNPSNSDLYAWGMNIIQHRQSYQVVADLLRYPIMPAFEERGLGCLVIDLSPFAADATAAKAGLQVADAELAAGRISDARHHAAGALALASKTGDTENGFRAQLLIGRADLAAGDIGGARRRTAQILTFQTLPLSLRAEANALSAATAERAGDLAGAGRSYALAAADMTRLSNYLAAGDALSSVGRIHVLQGDTAKAALAFRDSATSFEKAHYTPGQGDALLDLAKIDSFLGKSTEAVQVLTEYNKLAPATEVPAGSQYSLRTTIGY